jgi:hypothetical protein
MAHPQVADIGDGLQMWRITANILNKQSQTADGVALQLGVWAGANNPHHKKIVCCEIFTTASEMNF